MLYQGQLEYTVPEGDKVVLAKFDLETHSRTDAPADDSEGALDLQGDDAANVQGFDLKGEAKLELLKGGKALLSGNIELPKVFADAEGNGLTGAIQVASDNVRGVHIQGIQVKAPLAFMGKVEVHNLFLNFNGERNGDAKATCNAESPGLRWDGGAEKIVLPTPDKLTVESVGLGFADGAFSYAKGTLNWAAPGKSIGAGIRVQKISISVCAGKKLEIEGRIGLTALPDASGTPKLTIPNAGLLFTGGDPWTLRAEAPTAIAQARPRLHVQGGLRLLRVQRGDRLRRAGRSSRSGSRARCRSARSTPRWRSTPASRAGSRAASSTPTSTPRAASPASSRSPTRSRSTSRTSARTSRASCPARGSRSAATSRSTTRTSAASAPATSGAAS